MTLKMNEYVKCSISFKELNMIMYLKKIFEKNCYYKYLKTFVNQIISAILKKSV